MTIVVIAILLACAFAAGLMCRPRVSWTTSVDNEHLRIVVMEEGMHVFTAQEVNEVLARGERMFPTTPPSI